MNWTKPYHGVRHLNGIPRSHQITCCELVDGKAEVYLLHLHGNTPFTRVKDFVGPLAECLKKGENWKRELMEDTI